jgi:hypothetical protein
VLSPSRASALASCQYPQPYEIAEDGFCVNEYGGAAEFYEGSLPFTYKVNGANPDGIATSDAKDAIVRAARAWNDEPGAQTNLVYGGTTTATAPHKNGVNEIMFTAAGNDFACAGASFIACTNGYPDSSGFCCVEFDIGMVSDSGILWTLGALPFGQNSTYDIQATAEHEIGHALTLGHVNDELQVMYGGTFDTCGGTCEEPRILGWGDRNGARYDAPTANTKWEWKLSNSNTNPATNIDFYYGNPTLHDYPVTGDWNGDGTATIGVVRVTSDGHWEWILRDFNSGGAATYDFVYGNRSLGAIPVVGDWNGDGSQTIGVAEPAADGLGGNYTWKLRNELSAGSPDVTQFAQGAYNGDDAVLSGNWDSDPRDSAASMHPDSTNHWEWHLINLPGAGNLLPVFTYGTSNLDDHPIVGDWNGDGVRSIGVTRPDPTSTNWEWLLRNTNNAGSPNIDKFFGTRNLGDVPVEGDWNGDRVETMGVARPVP